MTRDRRRSGEYTRGRRSVLLNDPGGRPTDATLSPTLSLTGDVLGVNLAGSADKQILFNDGGAFAGDPQLTWEKAVDELRLGSTASILSTRSGGGRLFEWRPTDYLTQNGAFKIISGEFSNLPDDSRRDDTVSIGFNMDSEVAGKGNIGLVFESHCGLATGCFLEGQSEIFFTQNNGTRGYRPLGFFLRQGAVDQLAQWIARSDEFSFWNFDQTAYVLHLQAQAGANFGQVLLNQTSGSLHGPPTGDWLWQGGMSLMKKDAALNGVVLAPAGGNVILGINTTPFVQFRALSVRFPNIPIMSPDGSKTCIDFGSPGTNYWQFISVDGATPIVQPVGPDTNIGLEMRTKAAGQLFLNIGAGGEIKAYTDKWNVGKNGAIVGAGDFYFYNSAVDRRTRLVLRAGGGQGTDDLLDVRDAADTTIARIKSDGVVRPAGYESSDGTPGATVTAHPGSTLTVKNGLITAVPLVVIGVPTFGGSPAAAGGEFADYATIVM